MKDTMDEVYSISKRFKEQNPELFRLKPNVSVFELLDNQGSPAGKIKIDVKHPRIFDIRLIPKQFEGIEIMDINVGKEPVEFSDSKYALPWYEIFSPENYRKFVTNNLDTIRRKQNKPNWNIDEALNALTGDFVAYEKKCIEARDDTMEEHKEHVAFFKQMLIDVESIFEKSDIKKKYGSTNSWMYSVLATSIFKHKPMIVGFNWGAASGVSYEKQTDYPIRMFESNYKDLGSLKRVAPYMREYFPEGLSGMQINFCFFRSAEEKQISQKDLDSCADIFFKLVAYAQPSSLLIFSKQLLDYFLKKNLIMNSKTKDLVSKDKTCFALKGSVNIEKENIIPIYYIPHPNSKLDGDVRKKFWEFCFVEQ